jgi:integrase
MQRGSIVRHHGRWVVRWYDVVSIHGELTRKRFSKVLASVGPTYPTRKSVEHLTYEILQPLNAKHLAPESAMLVSDFIADRYLPHVESTLRPSTHLDYTAVFEKHVKPRLGDLRLRDFRTVHGQRLLADIARDNPSTGHKTLLRVKSFLSGALTHAKREGLADGENPMRGTSTPGKIKKFSGATYTLPEIFELTQQLSGVAYVAVFTAAFTGLRLAELRGLRWEDFDGTSLKIRRTVWRTKIGDTKNPESSASVPVLPLLQKILENYRKEVNGKDADWVFRGPRGASWNLANLVRREIIPRLARCSICHETKRDHKAGHEFLFDDKIPQWRGWHSYRRSLASLLYSAGVTPKVIQAIMRHSDIGTTLQYYVSVPTDDTREGLDKMEHLMRDLIEEEESHAEIVNSDGEVVSADELFRAKRSQD